MTPLEWIGLAQLVIIPVLGFAWRTWGHNVKNAKVREGIGTFVRGAEEISAAKGLPCGKTKESFVLGLALDKFWKEIKSLGLDEDDLRLLISAAVQEAGIGKSGKKAKSSQNKKK